MTTSSPDESVHVPRALIDLTEFGERAYGWSRKRTYEQNARGLIPVPVHRIGKRLYVRRVDAEAFMYGQPQASAMQGAESPCDVRAS